MQLQTFKMDFCTSATVNRAWIGSVWILIFLLKQSKIRKNLDTDPDLAIDLQFGSKSAASIIIRSGFGTTEAKITDPTLLNPVMAEGRKFNFESLQSRFRNFFRHFCNRLQKCRFALAEQHFFEKLRTVEKLQLLICGDAVAVPTFLYKVVDLKLRTAEKKML
jgi:hypothetical protein